MYLHIGGDAAVRDEDILAVFDMDNATASHITRAALRHAEREKKVINTAEDLPRSFVLCSDGTVWLSGLNPATLLRRAENETYE